MTNRWTRADLGDQSGKVAVVTGGAGGIGFRTAELLAQRGAHVLIGARDAAKADAAVRRIAGAAPGAAVEWQRLDLADLTSVTSFASAVRMQFARIDLLVNCAGVMAIPERTPTRDGIEMHFGTNHIGHFALTGQLLPHLGAERPARVITVSAQSSRTVRLDRSDLAFERTRYTPMRAYSNSKLANVLFAVELNRHVDPSRVLSVAVHPGTANTDIQQYATSRLQRGVGRAIMRTIGQPLERVADPILFAATTPDANSTSFVAPTGPFELGGSPGFVPLPPQAFDEQLRAALWRVSEDLSGVRF